MSNEKVDQLSMLQHTISTISAQKQNFQSQLLEIESALKELEKTGNAYKIIGNIMVKTDKQELEAELKNKREIIGLRIKSLEKQESQLNEKASAIQKEVLGEMRKNE